MAFFSKWGKGDIVPLFVQGNEEKGVLSFFIPMCSEETFFIVLKMLLEGEECPSIVLLRTSEWLTFMKVCLSDL